MTPMPKSVASPSPGRRSRVLDAAAFCLRLQVSNKAALGPLAELHLDTLDNDGSLVYSLDQGVS